jgi:hypothetical protein
VAGGYDEEAHFQLALEASKADKDEVCPRYSEAIKLIGLVANHLASLPPPLPPHARPFADYEGQEVPPPPEFRAASVAMTTRRGWSSTRRRSPSRSCGRISF